MTEPQSGDAPQEQPKIIVDDDWKAQAKAEKQRLAEESKKKASEGGQEVPGADAPKAPGAGAKGRARQLPEATFTTLVTLLANQAMLALGGMEDPDTKRRIVDLDVAKHQIDSLSMLEEKTKGNLTDEEAKVLDSVLYQVRMNFVSIAQAVASGPGPAGAGPAGPAAGGPTIQEG